MLKVSLLLVAGLALSATIADSQTAPPTLPPRELPRIAYQPLPKSSFGTNWFRRTFSIGGKRYLSILDLSEDKTGPQWTPSAPLPIAPAKAEQIARSLLRKIVADESHWQVSDLQITRPNNGPNWYIAVTLEPGVQVVSESLPHDSFTVLLDFTGRPGVISQLGP